MTHNEKLTEFGKYTAKALENIEAHDSFIKKNRGTKLHVQGVASALVFAYEQLRSVSENIEDHLLLQRAIERFYKRNLFYDIQTKDVSLGTELIIELTQAQYLENDSVPLDTIKQIDTLLAKLLKNHKKVVESDTISRVTAEKWLLEILSVKTEQLLSSTVRIASFAHVAHQHFSAHIEYERVVDNEEAIDKKDFPILLYIAIHRALLKSDNANARTGLYDLYAIPTTQTAQYIAFNKEYDKLTSSKSASQLSRFVTKNGAPLRIMRTALFGSDTSIRARDIGNMSKVTSVVKSSIDDEYEKIHQSINRGVVKSIIFLLVTKALIGLLIEIPYDLIVTGTIVLLPLVVNLLLPPLFLTFTALTFRHPGTANKIAISEYIESMLYVAEQKPKLKYSERMRNAGVFNLFFILIFFGVFYVMSAQLAALGFNIVHGVIFLIFFSTASFLGYRLTQQIRELEHIRTNQGSLALLRDFVYSPFIFAGQKISYRFGRLNIFAQVLDLAVDLPLKTFIRLLRQWSAFMSNKKDELL